MIPMLRIAFFLFLLPALLCAQTMPDASPRSLGDGPFDRLIIRGVTLIDGTGAPPYGPVDIVIEGNEIKEVKNVGYPGLPINDSRRPKAGAGDKVIDAEGMYALPGFIDMHGHTGGNAQGTHPDYVYRLWLGHGITTVREPGSFVGLDWTLRHKKLSEENKIDAPRIYAYVGFGMDADGPILTPKQARSWVKMVKKKGADGLKLFGMAPDVYQATIEEANEQGLRSTAHHAQLRVVQANVLTTARWGLTSMEHWYGLPEALFEDRVIQDYPVHYNYNNEQHRFAQAGKLWTQAAAPYSDHWNAVMNELIALDFTLDPTFTIYEASRDLMAQRRAEWHEEYTLPSLWEFYKPNRISHGSYWFNWGTEEEVAWKENYRLWMTFVNEYKNRGGRVTTGSDAGYIYKLYGFGFIQELELFREAGFHPLEVIQSATIKGAEALGADDKIGTVEPGKLADLVIVPENPLANFKVLYGTGAVKVDENNTVVRVGGVRYTIKDGIVYDAPKLLASVKQMVREAKEKENYEIRQPGIE